MVLILPGSVCRYVEFLAGSGAWMMSTEQIVFVAKFRVPRFQSRQHVKNMCFNKQTE